MARFGIRQWTAWEWKFWALVAVPSALLLWFSVQQLQAPYETSMWFALATAAVSLFFFVTSLVSLATMVPSFSFTLRLPVRKKIGAVNIKNIGPSLATRLTNRLLAFKIFRSTSEWMADRIESEVIKSGIIQSPSLLAQKYFTYAAASTPVCVVLAIILATYVSPLGALVIFAPALIAFMPRVSTRVTVQDRDTQTDKELGTFLIYAAEQQSAGGHRSDLLSSFESIIPTGLFKQLRKEAEKLVRDVHLFTKGDYLAALEKSGLEHPNRRMKDVLIGYVSESRTGGDIAGFLENTADEAFKDEQFRWKTFAERVSTMGEVIVMALLLFPAAGAVMGAVAGGSMGTMLMLAGIALSPMLALVLFIVAKSAQPGGFDDYIFGDVRLAVIGGIAGLIVGVVVSHTSIVLMLVFMIGGASLGYGMKSRLLFREVRALESGMSVFLADISEMIKLGFDLNEAVKRLALEEAEKKYSGALLSLMRQVKMQLLMHRRLGAIEIRSPSWLARYVFFMVAKLSESGGGTPSQIDKIRRFVSDITRSKKEATSSVSLFMLLAYATPFAVFMMTGLIGMMVAPLSGALSASASSVAAITSFTPLNPLLIQGLAASATLSVVFAMMKPIDLTIHNTMRITVACALIIVASYVVPLALAHVSLGVPTT